MIFYKLQCLQNGVSSRNTSYAKFSIERRVKKVLLKRRSKHLKVSDTGYRVYLSVGKQS